MTRRHCIVVMSILGALLMPMKASPHGHPPAGESRTIFESYGLACVSALHAHFHHPAVSMVRVVRHGLIMEIFIPHSRDLPHALFHTIQAWDISEIARWQDVYNDAHHWANLGHAIEVRAKQMALDFRFRYQDVCDHRRRTR